MAGATAYEGAARAEGADIVVGRRAGAAQGGGNMAAGQSVSNRRAERSSYAESRARRRRYRSALLRPLAVVDSGRAHTHLPRTFSGYLAGARATTSGVSRHRWVPWSTVSSSSSSSSSSPSSPLSIPPVSPRASTGGSSRRATGNSRAKINEGIGGKS